MKFCTHCGTELSDNARFCGKCGAASMQTDTKRPTVTQHGTATVGKAPEHQTAPAFSAFVSFALGIISICIFYVPIISIIISCIAKSLGGDILANYKYSTASTFARIGRNLGGISLPLSIIFTPITLFTLIPLMIYLLQSIGMIGL